MKYQYWNDFNKDYSHTEHIKGDFTNGYIEQG